MIRITNESADGMPVVELQDLLSRAKGPCKLFWHSTVTEEPQAIFRQIVDEAGKVFGTGALAEEALDRARRSILSLMPLHSQTRTEFQDNSLLIPVVACSQEGNRRMQVANLAVYGAENALYDLRQELYRLYFPSDKRNYCQRG